MADDMADDIDMESLESANWHESSMDKLEVRADAYLDRAVRNQDPLGSISESLISLNLRMERLIRTQERMMELYTEYVTEEWGFITKIVTSGRTATALERIATVIEERFPAPDDKEK